MTPAAARKLAQEAYSLRRQAQGKVCLFSFDPTTGRMRKVIHRANLVLYSGADILAKLLAGTAGYSVTTMYLEFKNLADPSDPITPPAFDRTGGIAYYTGLSSSPDVDYLRVPLVSLPDLTSSDGDIYDFNQAAFFAMSEGIAGVHGKTFSSAANSAVYGAALAATPDPGDPTADLVFSRVYTGIDKILKETGFEIGVTWDILFT
jgi:hypothetical protein